MNPLVRLGTTSYIVPDDLIPNVRYLGPRVDDIELVLFESREASNLPNAAVIAELKHLALEHSLTYTVHFPLDVFPGSVDARIRRNTLDTYLRIIDLCKNLDPFSYVLHLTPDNYGPSPSVDIPRWLGHLDDSLYALLDISGLDPRALCAETLSYPFGLVYDLVERHDLSITLDIGHVWLMGYDAQSACERYLPRTRVCHLHGLKDGHDHLGLEQGKAGDIDAFLLALEAQTSQDGIERVLTVEVFGEPQLDSSLSLLKERHGIIGRNKGATHV